MSSTPFVDEARLTAIEAKAEMRLDSECDSSDASDILDLVAEIRRLQAVTEESGRQVASFQEKYHAAQLRATELSIELRRVKRK